MDLVTMARGNPTKGVEARPVDCEGVGNVGHFQGEALI